MVRDFQRVTLWPKKQPKPKPIEARKSNNDIPKAASRADLGIVRVEARRESLVSQLQLARLSEGGTAMTTVGSIHTIDQNLGHFEAPDGRGCSG